MVELSDMCTGDLAVCFLHSVPLTVEGATAKEERPVGEWQAPTLRRCCWSEKRREDCLKEVQAAGSGSKAARCRYDWSAATVVGGAGGCEERASERRIERVSDECGLKRGWESVRRCGFKKGPTLHSGLGRGGMP